MAGDAVFRFPVASLSGLIVNPDRLRCAASSDGDRQTTRTATGSRDKGAVVNLWSIGEC
jgi:hypothetical protein